MPVADLQMFLDLLMGAHCNHREFHEQVFASAHDDDFDAEMASEF